MKRGIMMHHPIFEWVIWIGQTAYKAYQGAPFELRIHNRYYQMLMAKDTDWLIAFQDVSFVLDTSEIYKVRIHVDDYKPFILPL